MEPNNLTTPQIILTKGQLMLAGKHDPSLSPPRYFSSICKPDSVSSLGLFLVNHIMKETTTTTEQSVLNTSETWRIIIRLACVCVGGQSKIRNVYSPSFLFHMDSQRTQSWGVLHAFIGGITGEQQKHSSQVWLPATVNF